MHLLLTGFDDGNNDIGTLLHPQNSGIDTKIVILCHTPGSSGIMLIIDSAPFILLVQAGFGTLLRLTILGNDPLRTKILIRVDKYMECIVTVLQDIVRIATYDHTRAFIRQLEDHTALNIPQKIRCGQTVHNAGNALGRKSIGEQASAGGMLTVLLHKFGCKTGLQSDLVDKLLIIERNTKLLGDKTTNATATAAKLTADGNDSFFHTIASFWMIPNFIIDSMTAIVNNNHCSFVIFDNTLYRFHSALYNLKKTYGGIIMTCGFIGCGNMGGAIARAVVQVAGAENVFLANRTRAKADALARELGCTAVSNAEAAGCDFLFLGVKPHLMGAMLKALSPQLEANPDTILVSMAAGLTTGQIREMAGTRQGVIRIMPNTPSSIGAGMIQYCTLDIPQAKLDAFLALMAPCGRLDALDEHLIDAASAVSGSGPAFAYLFLEALADGGVACGLPREKALTYAAQMLIGSAQLLLSTESHPGSLKDAVCSPAGSTIQGVRALEQQAFRSAVINAVIATHQRNQEMGKQA